MGNGIRTKYLRNSLKIRGRKPIATSSFRSSSYSDLLITQFFGSLSRRFGSHIITSRFYLKFSLNWANSNWFNKKMQKMQAHKPEKNTPPKKWEFSAVSEFWQTPNSPQDIGWALELKTFPFSTEPAAFIVFGGFLRKRWSLWVAYV